MSESKAERTRQYILEKAAPIFNTKGYAGTSITDIMEATGLTKGAIYGNFENKDEVALAAFDHNLAFINRPLAEAIRSKEKALDKLLAMPAFYRGAYTHIAKRGGCAILNAATEVDDTHPQLRKKVLATIKAWKAKIEKNLQFGIDNGELKPGIDTSKTADVIIALIEGGIMLAKITGEGTPLNNAMDKLEEMILNDLKQ